jgi:MazG family protein
VPRPFRPVDRPALPEQRGETYPRLIELMQRLLAPDGCPWDREQTFASLRRYVLEEAAEVADAIDRAAPTELCDELGDLLFQVAFLGELARAEGHFGPDDVVASIVDKLVRRHPHVFAEGEHDPGQWERIKREERRAQGKSERGALDAVPRSLPALSRGQRLGAEAAKVGFDWPDARGPREKVDEELAELDQALASGDADRVEAELGDVLFAIVNVARHAGVDPEIALHRTLRTFSTRFAEVERRAREEHGGVEAADLDTLERYWQSAKNHTEEKSS